MPDSSVSPTPVSLLERLRATHAEEDWCRFVRLYTPLLLYWARRLCRAPDDPADLVQEVFAKLATELPRFRYDPQRRFRGWLHTILLNRWRDEERRRRRLKLQTSAPEVLDQLETPDSGDDWTEEQYRAYLVGRALEVMRAEFAPRDWQSFWEVAVNGRKADEVAQQLGITRNQVYLARSRIRHRLKCELAGLLEDV
jgi:RNA polymerase sigma-70 factor (ECF subfamily)